MTAEFQESAASTAAQATARRAAGDRQLVIVTGLSGAGKTSVLHAFEDLGFQVVDNLPLPMLEDLVDLTFRQAGKPLAVGVDSRTLHFTPDAFIALAATLRHRRDLRLHLLFIDANDETLVKRFSETRRRHPYAGELPLRSAIEQERSLMAQTKSIMDAIIDTSDFTTTHTRRVVTTRYRREAGAGLVVTCMSFGFANGAPRDADLVFDVRFLRNPHYVAELRDHTGQNEDVAAYVREDESFQPFVDKVQSLLSLLLPRYRVEGKSYLTIGFGCTGGKHRSVMSAELFAKLLGNSGQTVNVYHRDLKEAD